MNLSGSQTTRHHPALASTAENYNPDTPNSVPALARSTSSSQNLASLRAVGSWLDSQPMHMDTNVTQPLYLTPRSPRVSMPLMRCGSGTSPSAPQPNPLRNMTALRTTRSGASGDSSRRRVQYTSEVWQTEDLFTRNSDSYLSATSVPAWTAF